jgi:hypothetical protein
MPPDYLVAVHGVTISALLVLLSLGWRFPIQPPECHFLVILAVISVLELGEVLSRALYLGDSWGCLLLLILIARAKVIIFSLVKIALTLSIDFK